MQLILQERQILWFRQGIGRQGIKQIRSQTKPCPEHINPYEPIDIFIINRLVPHGFNLEYKAILLSIKKKPNYDPLRKFWHEAMETGKLYH